MSHYLLVATLFSCDQVNQRLKNTEYVGIESLQCEIKRETKNQKNFS